MKIGHTKLKILSIIWLFHQWTILKKTVSICYLLCWGPYQRVCVSRSESVLTLEGLPFNIFMNDPMIWRLQNILWISSHTKMQISSQCPIHSCHVGPVTCWFERLRPDMPEALLLWPFLTVTWRLNFRTLHSM